MGSLNSAHDVAPTCVSPKTRVTANITAVHHEVMETMIQGSRYARCTAVRVVLVVVRQHETRDTPSTTVGLRRNGKSGHLHAFHKCSEARMLRKLHKKYECCGQVPQQTRATVAHKAKLPEHSNARANVEPPQTKDRCNVTKSTVLGSSLPELSSDCISPTTECYVNTHWRHGFQFFGGGGALAFHAVVPQQP